jgi:hypothetical protein
MKTAATKYLEVTEAKYLSGYKLLLTFNDGAVQTVDFGQFLAKAQNPDTTDYRDLKKFKNFRIEYGDLIWGDHQMIFPIMDLYCGTILKDDEAFWQLNDGVSRRKITATKSISYKKSPKRKKVLQHV